MIARLRKRMEESEEGFTLIELLVVMIIIGILAAIAIPVFLNQRNSGYDAAAKSDVSNGSLAEESYFTDNSTYTTNGAGAAGSATGSLPSWSKSASTTGVTFVVSTSGNYYAIDATSKSGKHFCFDSSLSGNGVTANGTAVCTHSWT